MTNFFKSHFKWIFFASICCFLTIHFINKKDNSKVKFINVGTAAVTGLYYPTGGMICKMINNYTSTGDIKCSVQATSGSVYNLNVMRTGFMDMGIVQHDWAHNAYYAKMTFKNSPPMSNLRILLNLHQEAFTAVVRKDSDMYSFNDIKGKIVNIGAPGTGILGTMLTVLDTKGWDKDEDFKLASDLKSSEEAEALCDHKIDVMTDTIGHPNGALQEASSACKPNGGVRILKLENETINNLTSRFPYYKATKIPCNLYQLTDSEGKVQSCEDAPSIGVQAMLVTTDSLSDDVAYNVVKNMIEKISTLRSMHSLFSQLNDVDLVPTQKDIPIHPGALKYFKEKGLM